MNIFMRILWLICLIIGVSGEAFDERLKYSEDQEAFARIIGENQGELIEWIQSFPQEDYAIYQVPACGAFYLDGKEDFIKNALKQGISWEGYIQQLIFKYALPGSVVLDIGAHIGVQTLSMARAVGPQGKVLAFEPQPKIFRELFYNIELNGFKNVEFYPAAVGNSIGEIELTELSQGNEGATSLLFCKKSGKMVPLITIDSLNLEKVSFIKIDVECMENLVLEGAQKTLARCRPIVVVEAFENLANTFSFFAERNYAVYHVAIADYLAIPKEFLVRIKKRHWIYSEEKRRELVNK